MSYLVHQLTSLKLVLFFLQKNFIYTKKIYILLLILLEVSVIPAALTFYIFHHDGIRFDWKLQELVAAEVGGRAHLGITHICQGMRSDEIRGICFKTLPEAQRTQGIESVT